MFGTVLLLACLGTPGRGVHAREQHISDLATETFDAAWTIIRDTHFDRTMNGVDAGVPVGHPSARAAALVERDPHIGRRPCLDTGIHGRDAHRGEAAAASTRRTVP